MSRATEEYGDHPLFALERGEITEAEFRDLIHLHLENGFDFACLRALLRAHRSEPGDDRVHPRAARPRSARRCSRTTSASGSRSGARSCRRSTSLGAGGGLGVRRPRKPDPRSTRLTLERLGGFGPSSASSWTTSTNCEAAGPGHGRCALRERRAGDPRDRVSAGRRVAPRAWRPWPRERSTLRRCERSASQEVQADAATRAAISTPRSLGELLGAWRGTRARAHGPSVRAA